MGPGEHLGLECVMGVDVSLKRERLSGGTTADARLTPGSGWAPPSSVFSSEPEGSLWGLSLHYSNAQLCINCSANGRYTSVDHLCLNQ